MSVLLSRRQLLGALPLTAALSAESRPNVLFLAVDDLNDWIGPLAGHPQTVTPNIDRLAARGVSFERSYCQAPMCNPSRASLMTGLRPTTSGVYQNTDLWRDAVPDAVTLSQYFMRNGYSALGGGKIFHGSQNEPASWHAYHHFNGFLHPADTPVNKIPRAGHFDWSPIDVPDEETAGTRLAHWAGDIVKKEHSKPFFLACGFYRPHLPWYAPRKYFDRFPEESITLPPFLENDLDDVPKSAIRNLRDHDNVTSTGQWRKAVAGYLACISYSDANVGRVLDALDSGPNRDNTIIVLWTDHGWQLGEKKHWRKFTLWERSCRVPMMFVGPGVTKANQRSRRTVELLDIYPTLVDLCGLPAKPDLDGRSLRPLLENPKAKWDKPAITSLGPDKTSVRTERWRYTRYQDGEELYDHNADPNEWYNLAGKQEYSATRKRLASLFPKDVSRKKVKSWRDLSPEEKNLVKPPGGRHQMSDPENEIGLKPTL
ncbi:MAG: sulfatase [bacterium]|nr:sulfatase [bacterium]